MSDHALDGFFFDVLWPESTGIPDVVLAIPCGQAPLEVNEERGPRLKVQSTPGPIFASAPEVSFASPPVVYGDVPHAQEVVRYVEQNREALLKYWEQEYSSFDLIDHLVPVDRSIAERVASRFIGASAANLRKGETGIEGVVLYVSTKSSAGTDIQHGPRLKVMLGNRVTKENRRNSVSIRLTDPPVVLGILPGHIRAQAVEFVRNNLPVLLLFWESQLTDEAMRKLIRKV